MSGHSKWASIKHTKGANDKKKGVIFTRLSKNISLAAKNGKDPDMNPALRTAIDAAKAGNMPKDNIERAILRGAGELPGQMIEELNYECYAPGGVGIILQCATDNTNRTAQQIKTALNKNGGNLGGPGTVSYLFERRGVIRTQQTSEEAQLLALDAGAIDIIEEDDGLTIYTEPEQFEEVKNAIQQTYPDTIEYAQIDLIPSIKIPVDAATQTAIQKLLEVLEDNEDVIEVYHNAEFN